MPSTLDAVAYGGSGSSPPPLGISAHKEGPLSEASWLVWFRCHPVPIAAPPMIAARGGQAGVSLIRRGGGYLYPCLSLADPTPDRMSISAHLSVKNCDTLAVGISTYASWVCQFLLSFVNIKFCKVYNSSSSFVTVQMYYRS